MVSARKHAHSGSDQTADRTIRGPDSEADELDSLGDVPATVVCAICGDADCAGCNSERSRSGIVSIVSWERSEAPVLTRLWTTARATTREAEAFFGTLPDGPVAPALRFALLSEVLAAGSMLALWIPVAAVVAPLWLRHIVLDGDARSFALRVLVLAIPALAVLLVVAHAAHGLALNRGARRSGAPSSRRRALRFGLYATGWDLVVGPLGAVIIALKEGMGAAAGLTSAAVGLPGRSARAFLRGAYGLDGAAAKKALSASTTAAILSTIVGALIILAAVVALMLV
jgi:hypothetical protein